MQQILINGAWVDALDATAHQVVNPATLEPLGVVADCGVADVARAVAAARAALPGWRWTAAAARAALIAPAGAAVRARAAAIAATLSRETGSPLCEAMDCVAAVATMFERVPSLAVPLARPGVAVVMPNDSLPLLFMAGALVTELVAGRAVVCRPPPGSPLASLMLAQCFESLPPGVVNVLTGNDATARELVAQAGGEAPVGGGARHGVDAFMVCADVDPERAVAAVAWARLFNAGQAPGTDKHVYVARAIAGDFVDRMHPCAGFLEVDDPVRPGTDIGPLGSLQSARRVEDQVGQALRDGARLILGGRRFRPSGLPGHFFQPTILADVPAGSLPTREAILGPVITVTPVADLDEAIRLTQAAGRGGLSVHTADAAAASATLAGSDAGICFVNDPELAGAGPYSGIRDAGLRFALGITATSREPPAAQLHTAAQLEPRPWWFPYAGRRTR